MSSRKKKEGSEPSGRRPPRTKARILTFFSSIMPPREKGAMGGCDHHGAAKRCLCTWRLLREGCPRPFSTCGPNPRAEFCRGKKKGGEREPGPRWLLEDAKSASHNLKKKNRRCVKKKKRRGEKRDRGARASTWREPSAQKSLVIPISSFKHRPLPKRVGLHRIAERVREMTADFNAHL